MVFAQKLIRLRVDEQHVRLAAIVNQFAVHIVQIHQFRLCSRLRADTLQPIQIAIAQIRIGADVEFGQWPTLWHC